MKRSSAACARRDHAVLAVLDERRRPRGGSPSVPIRSPAPPRGRACPSETRRPTVPDRAAFARRPPGHRPEARPMARSLRAHDLPRHRRPAVDRRADRWRGRRRLSDEGGLRPTAADVHTRRDRGAGRRRPHGAGLRRRGHGKSGRRGAGQDRRRAARQRARPHRPHRDPHADVGGDRRRPRPYRPARRSVEKRDVLTLDYRDELGRGTGRDVRPLGLWFWGKVWTLAAWCELRNDFRAFRIDRIASVTMPAAPSSRNAASCSPTSTAAWSAKTSRARIAPPAIETIGFDRLSYCRRRLAHDNCDWLSRRLDPLSSAAGELLAMASRKRVVDAVLPAGPSSWK